MNVYKILNYHFKIIQLFDNIFAGKYYMFVLTSTHAPFSKAKNRGLFLLSQTSNDHEFHSFIPTPFWFALLDSNDFD